MSFLGFETSIAIAGSDERWLNDGEIAAAWRKKAGAVAIAWRPRQTPTTIGQFRAGSDAPGGTTPAPVSVEAEAMAELRRKLGRPKADAPKVHIGFRLAADVVESVKAIGPGYNARVAVTTRSRSSKPIGPFQVANQASISRRASFDEPPWFCRDGARSKERKPAPPCASSRSTFLS